MPKRKTTADNAAPPSHPIRRELVRFTHNVGAIRHYIDCVPPVLAKKERQAIRKSALGSELFISYLGTLLNWDTRDATDPPPDALPAPIAKKLTELMAKHKDKFQRSSGGDVLPNLTADELRSLLTTMEGVGQTAAAQRLHARTAVVSLCSVAEVLIGQILRFAFRSQPGLLFSSERGLTAKEVFAFKSIDEARDHLLDSHIDTLMRGSADDWISTLEKSAKCDLSPIAHLWPQIQELFQRRHLFVHCDGVVNQHYLRLTDAHLRPSIKKGDRLDAPPLYVLDGVATLESYLCALAFIVWAKTDKQSVSERGECAVDMSYRALRDKRFHVPRTLSSLMSKDMSLPETERLILKFNGWIAMKFMSQLDEVRSEVETLDLSASRPVFRLVRAAILDDFKMCESLLEESLRKKDIDAAAFAEWPVFETLRRRRRFTTMVKVLTTTDA